MAIDSDPDSLIAENSASSHGVVLHPLIDRISELRRLVLSLLMQWQQYLATVEVTSYRAEVDRSNSGRGRPSFVVSRQQLECLWSLSFTWSDIASLLGVSRMTIYRRREEYGMLVTLT